VIWILIVVLVCEVVILLKLLLNYRQRAHRMFLVQEPLRQRIKKHQTTLEDLGLQIRGAAEESVANLESKMAEQTLRCGYAGNTAAELDAEARADEGIDESEEEEEEDDSGDGIIGKVGGLYTVDIHSDRVHPVELIQSIRHELEDAFDYMGGIRRDITIVQHTTSRLGSGATGEAKS
jgi:hypothetical protein